MRVFKNAVSFPLSFTFVECQDIKYLLIKSPEILTDYRTDSVSGECRRGVLTFIKFNIKVIEKECWNFSCQQETI